MREVGIGTRELAYKIRVRTATVSGWRKGGGMGVHHLIPVCHVLGCSADWLLGIEQPGRMMEAFRKLAPAHQKALIEYLEAMTEAPPG